MKIQAIELTHYGPYFGTHRFELAGRGLVCVMGDNQDEPRMNSNGAGKSSLIEALDWCLFPVVPRGDNADSIINDEAAAQGEGCRVRVFAEDSADTLVIERCRQFEGKSGLRLLFNGEDVSALDAKETQRFVEYHLGVDRQVFHATVLFAQNDMFAFADATDGERIDILTKILRLERIDDWLARAKERRHQSEARLAQSQQRRAALQGQIEALEKLDLSAQAHLFEAQRKARLDAIQRRRRGLIEEQESLRAAVGDMDALRHRLVGHGAPAEPPELAQARADLQAAQKDAKVAQELRVCHQTEAQRLLALRDMPPTCSRCGQSISAAFRQDVDAQMQAAREAVRQSAQVEQQWADYIGQIVAAMESLLTAHRETLSAYHAARGQVESELKACVQANARLQQLAREQAQADRDLAHEGEMPNPFLEKQTQVQNQRRELGAALAAECARSAELSAELPMCDFWVEAFGPKGLKSYILDARLAEMTEAANYWCRLLTGGTYWVRLETQTALKTGALRNRFNIRVFNSHQGEIIERNYKSWSGGQKQRISLAVDFGLSRLIAQRAHKSYDLLILDEVFKHLDSKGREAVMDMLMTLRQEKSTILVVDHDAEFQAMFEERVVVRMKHGRASLHEESPLEEIAPEPPAAAAGQPAGVPARTPVTARSEPAKARVRKPAGPRRRASGGARQARGDVGAGDNEPPSSA